MTLPVMIALSGAVAAAGPRLEVEPRDDSAPLTVRLALPHQVLEAIARCRYTGGHWGPGGNGLSVSWGDGSDPYSGLDKGQPCSDRQGVHAYARPGTYAVEVTAWHPGPDDAPVVDWRGELSVRLFLDAGLAPGAANGPGDGPPR